MNCLQCGGEITAEAKFCPHCGKELSEPAPAPISQTSYNALFSLILGCVWLIPFIAIINGMAMDILTNVVILAGIFLTEIGAIICGTVAIIQIARSKGRLNGLGLAIAGIIIASAPLLQNSLLLTFAVSRAYKGSSRAKVSRVNADMRSFALAVEAYYINHDSYPAWAIGVGSANSFAGPSAGVYHIPTFRIWKNDTEKNTFYTLTTPIAYVGMYFPDPFAGTQMATFGYYSDGKGWILWSRGPDMECDLYPDIVEGLYRSDIPQPSLELLCGSSSVGAHHAYTYDPTNGTISPGDIWRVKQ